jgi:hypothetical protein
MFPHLTEKEHKDKVAERAAEKAAFENSGTASPCIMVEEDYHAIAGAAIGVNHTDDDDIVGIQGGHIGYVTFLMPEAEAAMYEAIEFNVPVAYVEPPPLLRNVIELEVAERCAVHRAELMHLALGGEEYEDVVSFRLKGLAAKTRILDDEIDYNHCDWAVSERYDIAETNATCAANIADKPELAKGLWLMDTGCARDLIGKKMAEGYEKAQLPRPFTFTTANGSVKSYQSIPMQSQSLECTINPYLLPETPAVLSVGRRCMEEGY